MNAKIKTVGEYHDAGVYRLKIEFKAHQDFGCDNYNDIQEVVKGIGEARRHLHNKLDAAIDTAAADFLKSKLKKID